MNKQTIAIDIDDVIADSTEALKLLVNRQIGANLTSDQYHNVGGEYWGYYERVWQTHGLANKISYKDFEAEMVVDQSHVPLLPGADFAIHELTKKFRIIFITARNKTWERATQQWFGESFDKKDIELYFCENHKDAKAKTKGQLCKELGVSLLIDDNVSHCQSALDENVDIILFGKYGWQSKAPNEMTHAKIGRKCWNI